MKVLANAKINLTLNVVGKRQDGYHELKTITYPLTLSDDLEIKESFVDEVEYNVEIEDDIVMKTIKSFKEKFKLNKCVKVKVNKHIPVGSGLGGGSADAAAVLKGMVDLFQLDVDKKEIEKLAAEIGADVPFCLNNKPALVKGFGEDLTYLPNLKAYVLLVTPGVEVLTKDIFKLVNTKVLEEKDITQHLIMISKGDVGGVTEACFNDLQNIVQKVNEDCYVCYRQISQINSKFTMTGSGSTYFALYESLDDLRSDESKIIELGYQTIHTTLA